jgi:hypothetical protein
MRPYLEKTQQKKRAGGVAQGIGPEFKPHYCQNKTNKMYEFFFIFISIYSLYRGGFIVPVLKSLTLYIG